MTIPAAVIVYREVGTVTPREVTPTGDVVIDVVGDGVVEAIEILWIDDPENVTLAREVARRFGLAFPRDLTASLAGELPDYDAARMRYPIAVSLELEYDVGYIRYGELTEGERLTGGGMRLEDPNGDELDVVVDYHPGGIFGIELLGFDPRIIDLARTVANRAGLAFPNIDAALAIDDEE